MITMMMMLMMMVVMVMMMMMVVVMTFTGHAYLTSLNDVDLDDHAYLLDVLDCDSTSFQLGVDQVYDCCT